MFATVVKTIVNNESIGSHVGFVGEPEQRETHVRALKNLGYIKYFDGYGFEMFSYSYQAGPSSDNNVSIVIVCDLDNPFGKRAFDSNVDWLHE